MKSSRNDNSGRRSRSKPTVAAENEAAIAAFFKGRPGSLKLFNRVRRLAGRYGNPQITIGNTQISFGEKYKYLWVWLPQRWIKKRPEDSVTLTLVTGKRIRSKRIEESVQPKKGFWTHHVLIESTGDVDDEVARLIKQSHDFYLERLRRRSGMRKAGRGRKREAANGEERR